MSKQYKQIPGSSNSSNYLSVSILYSLILKGESYLEEMPLIFEQMFLLFQFVSRRLLTMYVDINKFMHECDPAAQGCLLANTGSAILC